MSTKLLKNVEERLSKKGERFTQSRRNVLSTLLQSKQALKAYDIVDILIDVKPMTVYRALDFLVEHGLVHKIESLNAFAACVESHCDHKDSQYLICSNCEKVEELHNHAIDNFMNKELRKTGFTPHSKTMEIHGLCAHCDR